MLAPASSTTMGAEGEEAKDGESACRWNGLETTESVNS